MRYTLTLALAVLSFPAFAAKEHDKSHMGHEMSKMAAPDVSITPMSDVGPATQEYMAGMQKMHEGMAIAYTGNADFDFVTGMIPHHQGAIDMAKVVLKYGKDPEIKALAEGVIKAQDAEIVQMKAWLAKNKKPAQ